jgi:GNAT superfamily N-acetyltransferase
MRHIRRRRVVLREPTVADARPIAQVLVDSWFAAYSDLLPAGLLAGMSVGARQAQLEAALTNPTPAGAVRLVAELNGVIIAVANAGGIPPTPGEEVDEDSDGSAELAIFYVAPEHWRQGIGRGVMRRVLRKLSGMGYTGVRAWVMDGNEAGFAFFEAEGWSRATSRRGEIMDGHVVRQTRMDYAFTASV